MSVEISRVVTLLAYRANTTSSTPVSPPLPLLDDLRLERPGPDPAARRPRPRPWCRLHGLEAGAVADDFRPSTTGQRIFLTSFQCHHHGTFLTELAQRVRPRTPSDPQVPDGSDRAMFGFMLGIPKPRSIDVGREAVRTCVIVRQGNFGRAVPGRCLRSAARRKGSYGLFRWVTGRFDRFSIRWRTGYAMLLVEQRTSSTNFGDTDQPGGDNPPLSPMSSSDGKYMLRCRRRRRDCRFADSGRYTKWPFASCRPY
jgi:hypothetical protein